MSKAAKNGRKCGAELVEGIRGVWPEQWGLDEQLQARKMPWTPPSVPSLPPLADRNAFEMHSRGMKQKEIAGQQHRSQPSVSRGIAAVEVWLARTLPEDSGNLTSWERFRVAMVRHRIYLEHLKSLAEKEYARSCETLQIERVRTKTYPEGRKPGGALVTETVKDVYPKHQLARVSYLHFIDKVEHELAELQAGWLGNGNINMTLDKPVEIEERDRWDRQVKWQKAQIAELQAKLAAAEAKGAEAKEALGAGLLTPPPPATGGLPVAGAGDLRSVVPAGSETLAEQGSATRAEHEYEMAEMRPDSGLQQPLVNAPTPAQEATCVDTAASDLSRVQELSKVNKKAFGLGAGRTLPTAGLPSAGKEGDLQSAVSAGSETRAEQQPEIVQTPDGMLPVVKDPEADPQPRWEDRYRQEALDYHCLLHGLPPASLEQATGIPDPKKFSPRMWIEKGYPYMIHIDRSIPCNRANPLDTRPVIKLPCSVAHAGPNTWDQGWPRR